jgi:hypothetical protein
MTVIVNELDVQPSAAETGTPGTAPGGAQPPSDARSEVHVERAVRRRAERQHRLESY